MTRHDELREQYEDALFALLMERLAAQEGRRAREEHETLLADPHSAVSEASRRRCLRSIRRDFASRRARAAARTAGRVLGQFAAAMLAVALLFTTALAASEPFRRGVLGVMTAVFEDHTELQFDRAEPAPCRSIVPGWLPEGFEAGAGRYGGPSSTLTCLGPEGRIIVIAVNQVTDTSSVGLDTEDAQVTYAAVRGRPAIVSRKEGDNLLAWFDEERSWFTIIVSQTEPAETLLRVAEELELG